MNLNYFILFCMLLNNSVIYAQPHSLKRAEKRFNAIFERDEIKPEVLLLGTFHFEGEQVDANTTPENLRVDMLSVERQLQIEKLVQNLARFKPTKIAIELSPKFERKCDSLYQEYRLGNPIADKLLKPADERIQLAFRLAKLLKLEKLHPIDAQSFRFQLSSKDSLITYGKYKNQIDSSFAYWEQRYDAESSFDDSLAFFMPLNRYLRYLNSPQRQARTIGRWLVSTKRGTNAEPIGADGFITRYYNRNVRIYSNVQRLVTSKQDRILVIYGATHMYMLKQLFEASPEFKLKDIMNYLE